MPKVFEPGVFKRPDSPYWQLSYEDADGRRVRRACELRSTEPERKALKKLDEVLAEVAAAKKLSLPIVNGFLLFLQSQPLKKTSKRRYNTSRKMWKVFLDKENVTDFTQLTKARIIEYITTRRTAGTMDPTIRRDLAFLSSVWHFLLDHPEWEKDMPLCPITKGVKKRVKESKKRVRHASLGEWAAIMGAVNKWKWHEAAALTVGVETGMREQEMCGLQWSMLDLAKRQIVLEPSTDETDEDGFTLKSDKPRVIPMSETCFLTLQNTKRHKTSPYVFWHGDGERFDRFSNWWRGVRRRSGVKNFRLHDIRHTFATNYLNNGGDIVTLSHILGHSSVIVTERYAHLLTKTLHSQMQIVDGQKAVAAEMETVQ